MLPQAPLSSDQHKIHHHDNVGGASNLTSDCWFWVDISSFVSWDVQIILTIFQIILWEKARSGLGIIITVCQTGWLLCQQWTENSDQFMSRMVSKTCAWEIETTTPSFNSQNYDKYNNIIYSYQYFNNINKSKMWFWQMSCFKFQYIY